MVQLHVYFRGIVQGVGFRYTVHRYATGLGLKGWVRNLPDGRVEMKAEGERQELEDLLSRIADHFQESIRDREVYWEEHLQQQFHDFRITF
ncbi:MAG: acylphosphatase [Candidatus Omnitrophota bacterium]